MRDPIAVHSKLVLSLEGVERTFRQAGEEIHVLRGCALTIGAGELVALIGPSGAGKSTLLHIAGLLERPDSGRVMIAEQDATTLSDRQRTRLRRDAIGFVYQFHHLLPEFTAAENIVMPQMIAGTPREKAAERARELLKMVDLSARAEHRPARLSGGEQQRVAIVRALANNPDLLLADEPTGNLDPTTSDLVFHHLRDVVRETETGALVATHNRDLAKRMDRVIELRDGLLVEASLVA